MNWEELQEKVKEYTRKHKAKKEDNTPHTKNPDWEKVKDYPQKPTLEQKAQLENQSADSLMEQLKSGNKISMG